jgi:hypothetical protein
MLSIARAKLARETAAVGRRVVLKRGDMRSFELKQAFPFIYIPASTFDHNKTVAQQRQTLNCINKHLEKNGTLAFDLEQMTRDTPEASWWIDRKQIDEERMVVRSIFTRIDMPKRTCSLDLFFDSYRNGKLVERYHEYGEVALISKSEVIKLLEETHFKVESVYGDFSKKEYQTDSPRIVLVAGRK